MNKTITLTLIGRDSWDRPVYECGGKLYVDTSPHKDRAPGICAKSNNEFDGEPDWPVSEETEIIFVPFRDTW